MESRLFLPKLHTDLEPGNVVVAGSCHEQCGRFALWCVQLPVGENGSGRGRLHIVVSAAASRWKDLSCSERDRARGKTSHFH